MRIKPSEFPLFPLFAIFNVALHSVVPALHSGKEEWCQGERGSEESSHNMQTKHVTVKNAPNVRVMLMKAKNKRDDVRNALMFQ
jgi:hypothetical protein